MLKATIRRSTAIQKTARVLQVSGMFDVPPAAESREEWDVSLDLPQDWHVGLIVGPSGSGKTTIATELFGAAVSSSWDWPHDKSLLDGFPPDLGAKDIVSLLSSVGFSSPPLWLRPYHVLSTGQRFRVDVARGLAEHKDLLVVDEFTSVVDRTVAQIGACAVAKAVRRRNQRFIGVCCHYDVIPWMEPDWVYYVDTGVLARDCLHRPKIEIDVRRAHHGAWELFRPYHYLSHTFNTTARLYVAFYEGRPVAMQSVIYQMHPRTKNLYRGHRAVCLPDFQGVGIGNALIDLVASAYRGLGKRIVSTTASPALNAARAHNPHWICKKAPSLASGFGRLKRPTTAGGATIRKSWQPAIDRLTTTWEYIGPAMDAAQARALTGMV